MKRLYYIPALYNFPVLLIFILYSNLILCSSLKAQTEGGFRNFYTGRMEDSSKFQVDLNIQTDLVKGVLNFSSADSTLYLEGELSPEGKVRIQALNGKDSLEGQIYCSLDPFSDTISGTWINAKGNRTQRFLMQKIAEYVKLEQADDFIRAEARIPQFLSPAAAWQQLNLALNDDNSEIVNNFIADQQDRLVINKTNIFLGWENITDYVIRYYSDNFVSLLIRTEQYTVSDNPRILYSSQNIMVTDTGFRNIKLSGLFLPGVNYTQKLSDFIIGDLKRQKASWVENGEVNTFSEQDLKTFSITPQYLEFTFPPNTVAPNEGGTWFVKVPYSSISPYIDPGGVLRNFIRYGVDYYNLIPDK